MYQHKTPGIRFVGGVLTCCLIAVVSIWGILDWREKQTQKNEQSETQSFDSFVSTLMGKTPEEVEHTLGKPDTIHFFLATNNTSIKSVDDWDRLIWEYDSCRSLTTAKQIYISFDQQRRVYQVRGQR